MTHKIITVIVLLCTGCAISKRKQEKWIVTQARGLSFQVQGRDTWYRLPQGDSAVKTGDTIYVNYPGHEAEGTTTRWHTRRKYKG